MTTPRTAVGLVAILAAFSVSVVGAAQPDVSVPAGFGRLMLSMPKPGYPPEALARRITGSGLYQVTFDIKTGAATGVSVVESTHSRLLDAAAMRALSGWRARPGRVSRMRVPLTFTFIK
jgi:TonB family protein